MNENPILNNPYREPEYHYNVEDFTSVLSRILGAAKKGKRLIILNDEAHHSYLPKEKEERGKKDEETTEEKREKKKLGFLQLLLI